MDGIYPEWAGSQSVLLKMRDIVYLQRKKNQPERTSNEHLQLYNLASPSYDTSHCYPRFAAVDVLGIEKILENVVHMSICFLIALLLKVGLFGTLNGKIWEGMVT